jgi:hypothetical protein
MGWSVGWMGGWTAETDSVSRIVFCDEWMKNLFSFYLDMTFAEDLYMHQSNVTSKLFSTVLKDVMQVERATVSLTQAGNRLD